MLVYKTDYCVECSDVINSLSSKVRVIEGFPDVKCVDNGIVLPRKIQGGGRLLIRV